MGCLFILFVVSFAVQKLLSLIRSHRQRNFEWFFFLTAFWQFTMIYNLYIFYFIIGKNSNFQKNGRNKEKQREKNVNFEFMLIWVQIIWKLRHVRQAKAYDFYYPLGFRCLKYISSATSPKQEEPCLRAAVPNFLAQGTGFMEDNFSTDGGGGWGVGWGIVQTVMWAVGSGRWSFDCSPTARLLLCGPVPNKLRTCTGLRPRGWGPLP